MDAMLESDDFLEALFARAVDCELATPSAWIRGYAVPFECTRMDDPEDFGFDVDADNEDGEPETRRVTADTLREVASRRNPLTNSYGWLAEAFNVSEAVDA